MKLLITNGFIHRIIRYGTILCCVSLLVMLFSLFCAFASLRDTTLCSLCSLRITNEANRLLALTHDGIVVGSTIINNPRGLTQWQAKNKNTKQR